MLDIEGLRLAYGSHRVLEDVTIRVGAGETVAILGPNGAGKTTLLRSLAGLHPPGAGRVLLDGENITTRGPRDMIRRGVRLVPQGRQVFAGMTVRENLEMGAWTASRRHRSQQVTMAINGFPLLAQRVGQLAGSLSGGEQSMLALARGLVLPPQLLCLDEPSLGLAPVLVEQIAGVIRAVAAEGDMSVLLVEQNAALALELASRAYILGGGRVTLEGPSRDLVDLKDVHRAYLGGGGAS